MDSCERKLGISFAKRQHKATKPYSFNLLQDQVRTFLQFFPLLTVHRTLDSTRPINDNCGWEHVKSDLTTFHEYADAPALAKICSSLQGIMGPKAGREMFVKALNNDEGAKEPSGAPIICTEFGGVNIAPAEGTNAGERDWGYTTASDADDLLKRLELLVMAIVNGGHCCGFVYTQL